MREGKDGWIDLFCPGGVCCTDDGEFFSRMVRVIFPKHPPPPRSPLVHLTNMSFLYPTCQVAKIMKCCVNKKKFLLKLKKTMLGPFMLLSLRGDKTCIEVVYLQVILIYTAKYVTELMQFINFTDFKSAGLSSTCIKSVCWFLQVA